MRIADMKQALLKRKAYLMCFTFITFMLTLSACDTQSSSTPPTGLVRKLGGHTIWVESVTWSPSSKYLASGSTDNSVRIWEVASGRNFVTLTDFASGVYKVAWSPDGMYIAVGSHGPGDTVQIIDTRTWRVIHKWNPDPSSIVASLAWSPDSKKLAISVRDILIWDITTNTSIVRLTLLSQAGSLSWSPDGKYLAFSYAPDMSKAINELAVVWEIAKGSGPTTGQNTTNLTDTNELIQGLAWSPNGKYLAVGSSDKTVKVWDMNSRQKISTLIGHTDGVESVTWSPDSERLAAGSSDMSIIVWDLASGKQIAAFKHPDVVNDVAWSPDGQLLASGCVDHNVYIWDVASGGDSQPSSTPSPSKP